MIKNDCSEEVVLDKRKFSLARLLLSAKVFQLHDIVVVFSKDLAHAW